MRHLLNWNGLISTKFSLLAARQTVSFWQLPMQSVTKISSTPRNLRFSAGAAMELNVRVPGLIEPRNTDGPQIQFIINNSTCMRTLLTCSPSWTYFTYEYLFVWQFHGWLSTQPGSLHTALQRKFIHTAVLIVLPGHGCVNNGGTAVSTMGHGCVQVPGCVEGHPWVLGSISIVRFFALFAIWTPFCFAAEFCVKFCAILCVCCVV